MKILFLTPRGSRNNLGGVEGHVRILTEELEKRGHKVKELSLSEVGALNKNRLPRAAGGGSRNDKFLAWGYLWKKRDLFRWADVIHVHDVFWWVVPLLPVIWGNKYYKSCKGYKNQRGLFITFHGWEGVCPPSRSAMWQKRMAAFLSDGTIGVGRFFEKWYGITPNKVVYGVLDSDCHVPLSGTRNDGLTRVAFLGRLEEVNGVEVVVEVLEKLTNRLIYKYTNRQIDKLRQCVPRIIFVGDGSYRKQAEKFGKVTGMVKNPQKYLVDADAVITSSYMSMLQAAAIGKPIIAVANSQLKEDYLNCHPLRRWIKVVRSAEELYKGLTSGNQGETLKDLEVAQEWALGQTPKKLADVYEELWKKYTLSFRTRSGIYLNRFPLSRE